VAEVNKLEARILFEGTRLPEMRKEIKAKVEKILAAEPDPIYKELAGRLGLEKSKYMPWIIEKLATLEQAKIVRELPAPSEEIAEKLALDKGTVDKHLQELIDKSFLMPTRKGPQMVRSTAQFHDAQTNPKFDEELGLEYLELWRLYEMEEWNPSEIEHQFGGEVPLLRVIPRWRSIKDIPGIMPYENVREILKANEPSIAEVYCACRRIHWDRDCGVPDTFCINLGRTAEYNINRGSGVRISVEEALNTIGRADEYYPVHTTVNQQEISMLLCNCHSDCCPLWFITEAQEGYAEGKAKYKLEEGLAKSRFLATAEPDKCLDGCTLCIEACPFGAIKMKRYPELGGERAYTDPGECFGCGNCVVSCPVPARSMQVVRPPEHIPEKFTGVLY